MSDTKNKVSVSNNIEFNDIKFICTQVLTFFFFPEFSIQFIIKDILYTNRVLFHDMTKCIKYVHHTSASVSCSSTF